MSLVRTMLVLAALALGLAVSAGAATPALVGVVGPGDAFKITLTKGGKKVTRLSAGTYIVTVSDTSAIHNYRLKGPGVSKSTGVAAKPGKVTWRVTLKRGTYTYVCDPHASSMKGTFTVS
ncbi:MAG: hypothetical protein H0V40_11980 [Actinobacteria bacterium]|nr:hypothetical protein [Actinomycetota bacterium]